MSTSILQTTFYHFSATETTGEVCAGVVKAAGVYQKNPSQHSADLDMLEEESNIKSMFINPTNNE